ncbi:polysaccharide lyase family 7 protein [Vibrio sp. RC27]
MFKKSLCLAALVSVSANVMAEAAVPADVFDMTYWKITLPMDEDKNGKVDEIQSPEILTYSHPDFFYLDENKHLVFQVQNKAVTTKNSKNARSELRQMLRGADTSIGTKDPKNNWVLAAHENAESFGSIGGKLEATLKVNHTSQNAKYPDKVPAFSVVVGQIHAGKDKKIIASENGFGHGNEPLKIFYKIRPGHEAGSVFFNYERNLAKKHPDRTDISYPVWGNGWDNAADPKENGLKLGEEFSYSVNVYQNTMYLTFSTEKFGTKKFQIDLTKNVDAFGKVDEKDFARAYEQETFYFKAGAYGQCSASDSDSMWSPACEGTGDFTKDKLTNDYNSVTFSKLTLGPATAPEM